MKHDWYTNREGYDDDPAVLDDFDGDDSWLDEPDIFRLDAGYCNGPECKRCGRMECHHCKPGIYNEECPAS